MSSDAKPLPPGPAKGQQSLYPNPNPNVSVPQPPTYEETMSPEPRAMPFQPMSVSTVIPPPVTHQHRTQVPVVQHVFAAQPAIGPNPIMLTCSSCSKSILTKIEYQTSTRTHIIAGLLCCFICWPFAWVPYVVDTCKNANHYCSNCGAYVGKYKH